MALFVGVKVERASRPYSILFPLRRGSDGVSRLTTLTPEQEVAEFDVYLLKGSSEADQLQPVRTLHHFRVSGVHATERGQPLLEVRARRLSRRRLHLTLVKDGSVIETIEVKIPRSVSGIFLAVTALLAIALALIFFLPGSARDRQAGPAHRALTPAAPSAVPAPPVSRNIQPVEEKPAPEPAPAPREPAVSPEHSVDPAAEAATVLVQLETTIYFGPDSYALTRGGRSELERLVAEIGGKEIAGIVVEGHTALYGNEAGREMISVGRVASVVNYLKERGTPLETVSQVARGAEAPVTRATERQHLNRRAVLKITYRQDEQ